MIKAIETSYKGYRFRSRLEARWAVFFDAMGIKWQYEPEGFEKTFIHPEESEEALGEGAEIKARTIRYLPDFYLPATGTWVEVKGVWTAKDLDDTACILDWGSPLWNFDDSAYEISNEKRIASGLSWNNARGLLLLGDIPDIHHGFCFHPIIQHAKGLDRRYAEFTKGRVSLVKNDVSDFAHRVAGSSEGVSRIDGYEGYASEQGEFFRTKPLSAEIPYASAFLMKAYAAAKSARFEFGESGARV